jgi:hypothetical protein
MAAMPERKKGNSRFLPVTSSAEVRHLVGAVANDTVLAILNCQASAEDLEVAVAYAQGEGSAVDLAGHPMTGKVAQLYDILSSDALYADTD